MSTAERKVGRREGCDGAASARSPRVFGLSAVDLHDAWWTARGVQCVRLGEEPILQRAAELYLLLEPEQLVVFDLAGLCDRLTWHDALVTRLRVSDEEPDRYGERVVCDEAGRVARIERRYHAPLRRSGRVILTGRARLASLWASAAGRRAGWLAVRGAVPWSRVDHWRVQGLVARQGDGAEERRLIGLLVERWPRPDQSISGIEESPPGVWHIAGERVPQNALRIGPLWLGRARSVEARPCLVGPAFLEDLSGEDDPPAGFDAEPHPVFVREIAEVAVAGGAAGEEPARRAPARRGADWYPPVKRALDIVLATAALLLFMPLFLIIALLVLLEDGRPVFFVHVRQGRGGRAFRCFKFRTMHRNARELAAQLEAYNVCDGPQFFVPDDPRVTRVGRVLRRSHLDELPQLFNVVRGDMSLVGPRPSPADENQFCPAWRDSRLSVRPGVTGLWQLNRRRARGQDFQEWIRYDIEYVERACLRLDLEILAGTARIILLGRGDRAVQ